MFERAIAAGATELMPVEDSEDGDRRGGVTDPFGHIWYIGTHVEDISRQELPITASFATTPRCPAHSLRHLLVPGYLIVVHPREGFTASNVLEDQGHHQVAQHAGDGAGGLAVARPRTMGNDTLHAGAA